MNITNNQFAANTTANLVLAGTTAIFSMLGTIFIIVIYSKWVTIQTSSCRILLYISVSDFFLALGNFIGIFVKRKIVCLVQSVVVTFASLSSFFWTVFMAVYLYYGCSRKRVISRKVLFGVFYIFGWGVPFAITVIAAGTAKLGYNADIVTSGWCWVSVELSWNDMIIWMLMTGKFWEIVAYFLITVLYILIKKSIKRQFDEQGLLDNKEEKAKRIAELKLILVPLVFISLHIWGTVRFFIFERTGPTADSPNTSWLLYLQGIGDNGQGLANFLIFCFCTDKTQQTLRSCCRKLCFCRRQKNKVPKKVPKQQIVSSDSSRVNIEPKVKYNATDYDYADIS